MQFSPYLTFDGRCEEAFRFYETCFNARIGETMTFGNSPGCENMPADFKDKIIHMNMQVGNIMLMGSDAPPGMYEATKGMSVAIAVESTAEAERVFNALAAGGSVTMALQETFWSPRFGMLTDRFGIPWMVNTVPPA